MSEDSEIVGGRQWVRALTDDEKKRAAQWVLNLHGDCAREAAQDSYLDAPGNAERRLLHALAKYAGWDREIYEEEPPP